MLVPLKFPPGVRNVGTALDSKGRWVDANFVRWVEGVLQPIGRWVRITETPLTGRVSGIQSLRDAVGRDWIGVGTNSHCYSIRGSEVTDITPSDFSAGNGLTTIGNGYGAAEYGLDEYGTPRTSETGLVVEASTWSFDTWGALLIAVALSDGRVFSWDPGTFSSPADSELQLIANAPTANRGVLVTDERHLMLLAADDDPRKIQWSAREDFTVWTPTATNLAGDLILETKGVIQSAHKVSGEYLVLTNTDAFAVRYTGQPFAYGQERVGVDCGVIGSRAAVTTEDFVAWMSLDGFYVYRGQITPLPCDVWDFVFRELNYNQRALVTAGHIAGRSEIWWFFPAGDELKNNRYVIWNYRDNWWSVGYLERTAWQNKGVLSNIIVAGENSHIYEHDVGFDVLGSANRTAPYITSAPIELSQGDKVVGVTRLIPDRDSDSLDALEFEFDVKFAPRLDTKTFGPYTPDDTGYTHVRFTGRQVSLRVTAVNDIEWRLGTLRAEVKEGGKR